MTLLAALVLAAAPASPLHVKETAPVRAVHEEGGWAKADLLCTSDRGLVYLTPAPDLRLLAEGKVAERVALSPKVERDGPAEDGWECGMGSCDRTSRRASADGQRTLELVERSSNYWRDWESQTQLRDTGKPGLRADCPGGRPLLQCFTARRTVLVSLGGDANDDQPVWSVEYVALSRDGKETLHVGKGKVTHTAAGFKVAFANKGYGYVLEASSDPAAPAASLKVLKGKQTLQEEPCLGYALYPEHLAWFAGRK